MFHYTDHQPGYIIVIVINAILSLIVVGITIVITLSDPSDPLSKKGMSNDEDQSQHDFKCQICDSFVDHSSKHCGICNRCTY